MFIAMNRFKVKLGEEETFETIWKTRETFLHEVPGFHVFNLLKGPERGDHLLYVSHSIWADREAFENWTKSEAFRKAHGQAGSKRDIYLGPPEFEGFESIQEVGASILG
ncbi:MAG: antibiotic biosynthesis monooxygenase [Rhodospirillales bacterium]|nr:antibiotic biosynthesis monooxygenase [Rhodospirillales bacterium]